MNVLGKKWQNEMNEAGFLYLRNLMYFSTYLYYY